MHQNHRANGVTPYSDIALDDLRKARTDADSGGLDDNNEEDQDVNDAHAHLLPPSSTSAPWKSVEELRQPGLPPGKVSRWPKILVFLSLVFLCVALLVLAKAASISEKEIAKYCYTPSPTLPEYFQTTKTDFRGPTETGRAPILAIEDDVIGSKGRNGPLQTAVPLEGEIEEGKSSENIWKMMGHLSPWFMDDSGFGVDEFPLPSGANLSQIHMLHRHGARYPTGYSTATSFGKNLSALIEQGQEGFSGKLSFLNSWTYALGSEVLVPFGRQQLFTSGVSHYYTYGRLFDTSSKVIARTTTQDRMLKSAENFLAGFFGLDWPQNATLETIIEFPGLNNSLAGYERCLNSDRSDLRYGDEASRQWQKIYLKDATKELQGMSPSSFEWTPEKTFAAQQLCPYETIAFGYSHFCSLFTYSEWEGFEYAIDLDFAGNAMFQSPLGRAVGVGWVQELLARLNNHLITEPTAQDNITLDGSDRTFPLNQTLYFDFSHDTNIAAAITALGLTQFAPLLPVTGPPKDERQLRVSQIAPFAARLLIEIITTPKPVKKSRTRDGSQYEDGKETKYVHILLNSRSLPLGRSWTECGDRSDGWCELETFLNVQKDSLERAKWAESCTGDIKAAGYGSVNDGVP